MVQENSHLGSPTLHSRSRYSRQPSALGSFPARRSSHSSSRADGWSRAPRWPPSCPATLYCPLEGEGGSGGGGGTPTGTWERPFRLLGLARSQIVNIFRIIVEAFFNQATQPSMVQGLNFKLLSIYLHSLLQSYFLLVTGCTLERLVVKK